MHLYAVIAMPLLSYSYYTNKGNWHAIWTHGNQWRCTTGDEERFTGRLERVCGSTSITRVCSIL